MRWVMVSLGMVTMWCGPITGFAATADEEGTAERPIQVQNVIVSATKTEIPLSHATSAVEVITGADLERRKVRTVIDALRFSQGVFSSSIGGPGTEATVRMRGAQPKHTMVLIDGAIVNSPTTGSFNFANLMSDNIERIEILRGAQSMLYGSDAIGGVINIITKKGQGEPTASTFFEYGSFLSIREGVDVSGASGKVDYTFSLSRWDITNFSAVNYRRGAAERDRFGNWQGASRIGVALPHDGRLEFSLRWWDASVHIDNAFGESAFDVFGANNKTSTLVLSGSYDQPITTWWSQRVTLAQAREHFLSDSGTFQRNVMTGVTSPVSPFPADITFLNRRLEWQHNFQVLQNLLLTAGYQFREEQGDATTSFGADQPNRLLSTHAGFAEAQLTLFDRLLLTGGVRQDQPNVFGDATTYRITGGYLFKETGTKLRSSYATGFRAPTLNDLFFQGFGNPNLKPEESRSFDVAVDQQLFKDRLRLSAGYFHNDFDNLILFVSSPACPPTGFGICPVNIGRAKSEGVEASAQLMLTDALDVSGQYTYTATRDLDTEARLPRWPLHQASMILGYQPVDALRVTAEYRYVGARFNDNANLQRMRAFGVVNLAATYEVNKHMQVFGRLENLSNERYEEILFFGTPGRSVFGGVKLIL